MLFPAIVLFSKVPATLYLNSGLQVFFISAPSKERTSFMMHVAKK